MRRLGSFRGDQIDDHLRTIIPIEARLRPA
jgi:hypothetical protein